jgi:hypothetical protein
VLQGVVSKTAELLAASGDLIKRSIGLQWLPITYALTYAIVILWYWEEGCELAGNTMAAIVGGLRQSTKAALF